MVALLDRMDAGFVPNATMTAYMVDGKPLSRLARHGLVRGVINDEMRRVDYVRDTPHPTDFRLGCIPKSGWPTVEPESDNG